MRETLYISIILFCRIIQHLYSKKASILIDNLYKYVKYTIFTEAVCALLGIGLIAVCGTDFKVDPVVVAISVFSGIMIALSSYCGIFALQSGTITISSMFATAGIIIPCVFGIILFDQPMSTWQWVGIALFLLSAYFLTADAKISYKKFGIKTILLLIGGLLTNGFVMLAQQMFSFYRPDVDVAVFSFLSFSIVGILLAVLLPFMSKSNGGKNSEKMPKVLYGYAIALAIVLFIINQLATIGTAFISPAVLFSFINGGSTIIAMLIAWIFFGEKITKDKMLGLIIGIASLLIIKIL